MEAFLMTITSRRRFLRTGVFATLFAAVPMKNVLGQSWKQRDGNPISNIPVQVDPLFSYSEATFKSYLNSIFQLHTTGGIVEATLVSVDDMAATKGGECFSLLFRGGTNPQTQDTYTLVHPALGTFQLLLVPGGNDAGGTQGYVATVNRLSMVDETNMSPPARVRSTTPSDSAAASRAGTTSTPSTNPSAISISASSGAPSTPTTPAATGQPHRRKPVWKQTDEMNRLL
jgi:hypothetical protein